MSTSDGATRVAIIGGGLAGLAAAAALVEAGLEVELFEGRSQLGGRAASFQDPDSGEMIDHCQHVSMGCCANLADFFARAGASALFRRDRVLYWISPDGRQFNLRAVRWLPSPLHLAPGLWRLKFLKRRERVGIARALLAMARTTASRLSPDTTIESWLAQRRQSAGAIAGFWQPILISALADTLDRVSYAAARKVFVDGFMANRESYVVEVPRVSLTELYDQRVGDWLVSRGVKIHRHAQVRRMHTEGESGVQIEFGDGATQRFDRCVLAVPWHKVAQLIEAGLDVLGHDAARATQLEPSPITAVHLWFDRQIMDLPHAVLVDRMSQWVFRREVDTNGTPGSNSHYYQVVISGSRSLAEKERAKIVEQVCHELAEVWPAASVAKLLKSRVVTDRNAVFSPQPGHESLRPTATTKLVNVFLAGDWTATGWPATMEGAVRSGYLAAEAVLRALNRSEKIVVDERPREWLARWLIRNEQKS